MSRCCGFSPDDDQACQDQAMTPSCTEIQALGYTCDTVLPLGTDSDPSLEAGQTLAFFCPATCGTC
eukprot:SAG11_NODE_20657_length_441_cov_0.602339_2_plen_65_part_01